ncbi:MAG: hypothetical protein MZV49_15665 [Rhodopseudomonas palustris]|nr:hypothetical protein [Rhodopseudomonas palustris]
MQPDVPLNPRAVQSHTLEKSRDRHLSDRPIHDHAHGARGIVPDHEDHRLHEAGSPISSAATRSCPARPPGFGGVSPFWDAVPAGRTSRPSARTIVTAARPGCFIRMSHLARGRAGASAARC